MIIKLPSSNLSRFVVILLTKFAKSSSFDSSDLPLTVEASEYNLSNAFFIIVCCLFGY